MSLVAAVLSQDGLALRDLLVEDAELLVQRIAAPGNQGIFNEPLALEQAREFVRVQQGRLWARPMICLRDGAPVGALLNPLVTIGSLNTMVVALLDDPERDRVALALYVRHLFWSFPLHRIYVELPSAQVRHVAAVSWAGFQLEGRLADHLKVAGRFEDVSVYGLLRADFDAWAEHEAPVLALSVPDR